MATETPDERSTRHMAERAAVIADSTYRGWSVHYDNPPIPLRSMDWSATSPDYDVDCDSESCWVCSGQQVHAATHEALCAEIDAAIEEQSA